MSKKDDDICERALIFATAAHEGTFRKGSDVPYIEHPKEAADIVRTLTDDQDIIAAALLHDVVEDTDCTIEDIRTEFGERIASIVGHESEDKREGQDPATTWKIRKIEFLEGLRDAPPEAKMVALGDKLSNMRSTAKDFRISGDALWQKFNQKDKNEQTWYYNSIADMLSEFKDTDAWKEYSALCAEVFGD